MYVWNNWRQCHKQLCKVLPRGHSCGSSCCYWGLDMSKRFSDTNTRVTLRRILWIAAEMCRGCIFDRWRRRVNCWGWGNNLAAVQVILIGHVFYQESFFVGGTPIVMWDSCVGVFLGVSLFYLKHFFALLWELLNERVIDNVNRLKSCPWRQMSFKIDETTKEIFARIKGQVEIEVRSFSRKS